MIIGKIKYSPKGKLESSRCSKKLNITKQTVSDWENENIQPPIHMLIQLATLFGVTTDYLLGPENIHSLNVEGLPLSAIAHLAQIILDLKSSQQN